MKLLKNRVKARRLFLDMTQVDLARCAEMSQANVAHIESGRNTKLRAGTARQLAVALNVSVGWLVSHNTPLPEEKIMIRLLKENA